MLENSKERSLSMQLTFVVYIKTVSEANSSEHWSQKAKRHKQQQFFIRLACHKHIKDVTLPCEVTLSRLSPRLLDDDNLVSSLKYVRDEVSECLIPEKSGSYVTKTGKVKKLKGRADSDQRILWRYEQRKNTSQAVQVTIIY